jgi:7-cyano-7-deazaguanine synthase in queuosine biosynthesis
MLFEELRNSSNTEDQFAVLVDTVLAATYVPARNWVLNQLATGSLNGEFRLVAATALVSHALLEAWPMRTTVFGTSLPVD